MIDIQAITTNLTYNKDGIWYSKDNQDISYPPDGNELCFKIEDDSFWFKHRNNCILTAVTAYPPEDNGTIFDIGGGNGFVSLALAASGFDVALVEPNRTGALNAKKRGLNTVICATAANAHFKPHSLSAIGLFDVIEHIKNDFLFLKFLKALMKGNGRLYVTVPAYPFLWSEIDIFAGHYKRYTLKSICNLIKQAGFKVEFCSYFFRLLPIPIALFRTLPYRLGFSLSKDRSKSIVREHVVKGKVIANILSFFFYSEIANLRAKKPMSFGASCLVVAKNT